MCSLPEPSTSLTSLMDRFDGMTSQLNDAVYSLTMLKVEGVHGEEERAKLAHKMAALERV